MRVGILTASRTNNNGTDLQCAAMQRLLCRTGAQAEVIDYACTKLDNSRKLMPFWSLADLIRLPWRVFNHLTHQKFRKQHFVRSEKTFYPESLRLDDYDAVVVGSDQIWNLRITGGDRNFFLPQNCGDVKRFSYAASLGVTDVAQWEQQYGLRDMLKNFRGVSVRESSGVEALEKIGVEAREDLDPILCMTAQDWDALCPKKDNQEKYVLLYLVEKCPEALTAAREYAKKTGAKILRIGNISKPVKGVRTLNFVSIQKWLWLMKHAQAVYTNSYHGLSTAIAMHKNFRLFSLPNAAHNTRSLCLLDKLGLSGYTWQNKDLELTKTPDWTQTEQTLDVLRQRSAAYIKTMLEE